MLPAHIAMVFVHVLTPLLFRLFFFYLYGDHRDLHSFPTRRSSDLLLRIGHEVRRDVATVELHAFDDLQFGLDRKSTRLNSSHTVISYAVFCLKKKNREEQYWTGPLASSRQRPHSHTRLDTT